MSARNEDASEQALLGLCISGYAPNAYRDAAAILTREDFWRPAHALIWFALEKLHQTGAGVDAVVVERVLRESGKLATAGGGVYLAELVGRACPQVTLLEHAGAIAAAASLRRLAVAGQRIAQRAEDPDADPAELATWASAQLASAQNTGHGSELLTTSYEDWYAKARIDPPSIVPGLLGKGDRLVLTGGGGLGKSTLFAQIALCAAAGCPPLRYQHDDPFDPVKVSIFDFENADHRRKNKYWPIIAGLRNMGLDPRPNLRIDIRGGHPYDLLNRQNALRLLRTVEHDAPDLVYVGPVYKLHNDDPDKEIVVKKITGVLDGIREMGAALMTEAHPNKAAKHGGSMAPSGAALWEWWPEFGLGLRMDPDSDEQTRRCKLERWRIDRDESHWPMFVQASGDPALPWMEAPVVPGYLLSEDDPRYVSNY